MRTKYVFDDRQSDLNKSYTVRQNNKLLFQDFFPHVGKSAENMMQAIRTIFWWRPLLNNFFLFDSCSHVFDSVFTLIAEKLGVKQVAVK